MSIRRLVLRAILFGSLARIRDLRKTTKLDQIPGFCAFLVAAAIRRGIGFRTRVNFFREIMREDATVGDLLQIAGESVE